jgi:hypothetical protein
MKKVAIFFFIGLFMALISKYILENFSPIDFHALQDLIVTQKIKPGNWESLDNQISILIRNGQILKYISNNVYIAAVTILSSIFSFFMVLHLTIDKIFFKNYYEQASLFDAIRRGLVLDLVIGLVIYLKLYGIDLGTIVLVPIFFLIIEILFSLYIKRIIVNKHNEIKEFNRRMKEGQTTLRRISEPTENPGNLKARDSLI